MWYKYIFIFFLFYFFAVLQSSFFAHFNIFGAVPNLVFILFFLLVFFSEKTRNLEIIFYAVLAGLFLDLFSYVYFGVSIVLLLIIGFAVKKIQGALREQKSSKFPIFYFMPFFIASLIVYDLLLRDFSVAEIIYSCVFACLGFYAYKKLFNR